MNRRFIPTLCLILGASLLFTAMPSTALTGYDPKAITIKHVLLFDAENGTVLYEKDGYTKAYPASTTKVLTCIIAIEECKDLKETVTVGKVTDRGSHVGLSEGERMPLLDLLYGLMLQSGNDAAEAIAIHLAGSKAEFAKRMNEKAAELGMANSNFITANGLHSDEHYSTAYDMALASRYAMQNATFREIVATRSYKTGPTNKKPGGYSFANSNNLLPYRAGGKSYGYEYATGIKTGETVPAGRCLIASAEKDGRELIVVLFGDMGKSASTFKNAVELFDWGFEKIKAEPASS